MLSYGLKIPNFPGGACSQTPQIQMRYAHVKQVPRPQGLPDYLKFGGYGPVAVTVDNAVSFLGGPAIMIHKHTNYCNAVQFSC